MVTRLEEWGTQQEIIQLCRAYRKRSTLQQELDRRSRKLRCQRRHIQTQQILQAWKHASRYTKKNKHHTIYARSPIIDITGRQSRKRRQRKHSDRQRKPQKKGEWVVKAKNLTEEGPNQIDHLVSLQS